MCCSEKVDWAGKKCSELERLVGIGAQRASLPENLEQPRKNVDPGCHTHHPDSTPAIKNLWISLTPSTSASSTPQPESNPRRRHSTKMVRYGAQSIDAAKSARS